MDLENNPKDSPTGRHNTSSHRRSQPWRPLPSARGCQTSRFINTCLLVLASWTIQPGEVLPKGPDSDGSPAPQGDQRAQALGSKEERPRLCKISPCKLRFSQLRTKSPYHRQPPTVPALETPSQRQRPPAEQVLQHLPARAGEGFHRGWRGAAGTSED
ncbi:UNVERIFIED_CONTAM: hypothetical protein K2H54_052338 [Gekko kuhli]